MFCRLCTSTRPRIPAMRAAGLLSITSAGGGDVVYCVEHVCVQCPRRPAPGLQFRSPHRTECVRSTLDQTTAASRAGSRPGDGDGDSVQCRQEKLGGCFHSGGDDWRLLLGAA